MPSALGPRSRHRMLPAVVPPLIDAPAKRPPHLLPVPRDTAGHPWPTELDVRTAIAPPDPLDALLDALAALPPGTPQYLRLRGSPERVLAGLAQQGIDSVTEQMSDGSWRLRATVPTAAASVRAA